MTHVRLKTDVTLTGGSVSTFRKGMSFWIDGERDEYEVATSIGDGQYGNCYKACDRMSRAGLLEIASWQEGHAVWRRTPAGDAALAEADRRLLPREESTLFE